MTGDPCGSYDGDVLHGSLQLWWWLVGEAAQHGLQPADSVLLISLAQQIMFRCTAQGISNVYTVSTGVRPASCVENSGGTPLGFHMVAEKYGEGLPLGEVIIGRVPTGKNFLQFPDWRERGCVTSRILRLEGMEEGVNRGITADGSCVDSYRRMIYIHGTPHEHKLGTPNSAGCIDMGNREVEELHGQTPLGTLVYICPPRNSGGTR